MGATSILINIGSTTADAVKGIRDVNTALKDQEESTSKTGAAVKKMAVPAAAAFAAVSAAALGFADAAVEDAAGAQRMADNLAKSTGATQEQVDATEDWISAQGRALGVADDQLRPAMERLARSTGDLGEAQDLATLSMDIAAATGKDMETVSNAVAKANDGQMGALKKLGLTLGNQAENVTEYTKAQNELGKAQADAQAALTEFGPASKEYEKAMGKVSDAQEKVNTVAADGIDWVGGLGDQLGGAASSQAETAAGKMERFQLAVSETGEGIGAALLPVLEKVLPLLQGAAEFAQDNSTALAVLMGIVGLLAGAVLVVNGALAAWTAVTAIWSAATLIATGVGAAFGAVMAVITSPVTLVILAIVALIGIVVLLWKNWDKVTKALVTAFTWVKGALASAFKAIKDNITTIMKVIVSVIFPFIGIGLLVVKNWETIKTTLAGIWTSIKNAVGGAWDSIVSGTKNAIKALIELVTELPGKILKAIGNLNSLLYDKGQDLIRGLINGIKSMAGAILNVIKGLIPGWAKKIIPGMSAASMSAVTPAAARFMAAPTATATATPAPAREPTVMVTEEQIYRAVYRVILRGDARNGRRVMVG